MTQYVKKPMLVEAFRFGYSVLPLWLHRDDFNVRIETDKVGLDWGEKLEHMKMDINTLEGVMTANYGDFIVKGIKDEVYPVRYDIFMECYEVCKDV